MEDIAQLLAEALPELCFPSSAEKGTEDKAKDHLGTLHAKSFSQSTVKASLVDLHFCCQPQHRRIESHLKGVGIHSVQQRIKRHQVQPGVKGLNGIKNVIAVGSGKGGVGKSSISVVLAQALHHLGAQVALLDADIYGPSVPTLVGIHEKPSSDDGKTMNPIVAHGIKTISIGYLTEVDTPMIWRGPIVTNTLKQLLSETNWGELDYLIIDLPPGTGDTQLTLAQSIPVTAALVVTTPSKVAVADAQKAIRMFERVNIHVAGIIENMSYFNCPHCQTQMAIFGQGGGRTLAQKYSVDVLAQLPLEPEFAEQLDHGKSAQNHPRQWQRLLTLALQLSYRISLRPVDFTFHMPPVQVKELK